MSAFRGKLGKTQTSFFLESMLPISNKACFAFFNFTNFNFLEHPTADAMVENVFLAGVKITKINETLGQWRYFFRDAFKIIKRVKFGILS